MPAPTGLDYKVKRILRRLTQQQIADAAGRSTRWVIRVEQMNAVPPYQAERYEQALVRCADATAEVA